MMSVLLSKRRALPFGAGLGEDPAEAGDDHTALFLLDMEASALP
jgi:hypothetical protein